MAEFKVEVLAIDEITKHPDADVLDLARIRGYVSIVKRGQFATGDLIAYIPEAAIVPETILAELGLVGKLSGSTKNRVKAVRLRGIVSQGICYPAREGWAVGDDVAAELGIEKYEPAVPAAFQGQMMRPRGGDQTIKYDIENWKNYPRAFEDGEMVVFTEKLHGTCSQFGVVVDDDANTDFIVTSKGLGARGFSLKLNEENYNNIYIRTARAFDLEARIRAYRNAHGIDTNFYVLGEIFGAGVQDLRYGADVTQNETIGFRVFDMYVGKPNQGRWLNDAELDAAIAEMDLVRVPVLYRGPYSNEVRLAHTDGMETVSGRATNIREGIVMRTCVERSTRGLSRVQLKSISDAYLTRKGENGVEPTELS